MDRPNPNDRKYWDVDGDFDSTLYSIDLSEWRKEYPVNHDKHLHLIVSIPIYDDWVYAEYHIRGQKVEAQYKTANFLLFIGEKNTDAYWKDPEGFVVDFYEYLRALSGLI